MNMNKKEIIYKYKDQNQYNNERRKKLNPAEFLFFGLCMRHFRRRFWMKRAFQHAQF